MSRVVGNTRAALHRAALTRVTVLEARVRVVEGEAAEAEHREKLARERADKAEGYVALIAVIVQALTRPK